MYPVCHLIAAVSPPPVHAHVLLVQVHTLSGSCGQIFLTSTVTNEIMHDITGILIKPLKSITEINTQQYDHYKSHTHTVLQWCCLLLLLQDNSTLPLHSFLY